MTETAISDLKHDIADLKLATKEDLHTTKVELIDRINGTHLDLIDRMTKIEVSSIRWYLGALAVQTGIILGFLYFMLK